MEIFLGGFLFDFVIQVIRFRVKIKVKIVLKLPGDIFYNINAVDQRDMTWKEPLEPCHVIVSSESKKKQDKFNLLPNKLNIKRRPNWLVSVWNLSFRLIPEIGFDAFRNFP